MIGGLSSPDRPDGGVSAYQLVKRLLEETKGLYVPISFCTELVRLLNKDLGRSLFDITTQQINELSGLVATKIERRAADEFFNHPRFIVLLFFWFRFGDKGRLRERLTSGIENPSHLFRLLRAIAKERDFPKKPGSNSPYISKVGDLENFTSVDLLERKVATINQDSLNDDERFLIEAFKWCLEDNSRAVTP
jgi:hypothetical protein